MITVKKEKIYARGYPKWLLLYKILIFLICNENVWWNYGILLGWILFGTKRFNPGADYICTYHQNLHIWTFNRTQSLKKTRNKMQILGLFSFYQEAFKIIFSGRKILTLISFTFILPLCFTILSDIKISDVLIAQITHNQIHDESKKLSKHISCLWVYFWVFKITYFTVLLIFSFLSNAAVVYTIACAYSEQEEKLTFKKLMDIIPKVCTEITISFFQCCSAIFTYIMLSVLLNGATKVVEDLFNIYVISVPNIMLLLYIITCRQTASIASFTEEEDEIEIKSKVQVKGKIWVHLFIYLKMTISLIIIAKAFEVVVVHGNSIGLVNKVVWVIILLSLLLLLILFGLVLQTVTTFSCKPSSYLESMLLDPFHVNPADHLPLKAEGT